MSTPGRSPSPPPTRTAAAKSPGDRIKTGRRDAQLLARLHRAGELTAVHIPGETDEAIRGLCRARSDAVQDKRCAMCQLKAFDSVAASRLPHPCGAAPASQSVSAAPQRLRLSWATAAQWVYTRGARAAG